MVPQSEKQNWNQLKVIENKMQTITYVCVL